jgi:(2R)-ethylmalonyl-CoA mutase
VMPRWNPINVCSYHLQEAGATPVQEVAYALATAVALLDAVRDGGQVPPEAFGAVVGRVSFFVDAGVRFVEEMCKLRAFADLWDELTLGRYGVTDPRQRRFRYGVQVNSLGLTAEQPENNVARILLELLGVTLSKRARARAVQLPAWNEALGLPRPWDQQWSLRLQQVLAHESDLLEHEDLFDGSPVVEALTTRIADAARAELTRIGETGGVVAAVESGELKAALVAAHAARRRAVESGETVVVGINRFTETEPSPLTADLATAVEQVDPRAQERAVDGVRAWRLQRDATPAGRAAAQRALARLRADAAGTVNLMHATLECVRAGVTTGEWTGALREVFGEYHAPTGLSGAAVCRGRRRPGNSPGRPCAAPPRSSAAGCGCSWASPGSTGTATGRSRSHWRRGTPASRWSTRGSVRRPPSWSRPRSRRTCTASGSRCCRVRTWSWCPPS